MTRLVSVAVLCWFAGALPAAAQTGSATGRFFFGPLQWTPTLVLREAGVDSNVFNAPDTEEPSYDRMMTFTPQVDIVLPTALAEVTAQAGLGLIYYDRFASQRAVNSLANIRAEVPLQRFRPSVSMQWARSKDRSSSEFDERVENTLLGYSAQLTTRITPRAAVIASAARRQLEYESGVVTEGNDVAERLNRNTTEAAVAVRIDISPLTMLVLDGRGARDDFILTPGRQADNLVVTAGLEFAPDAVIRGRASVGYHKLVPRGQQGLPFAGLTSAVNLSYSLLGVTRFDVRFTRDAAYSVLDAAGYYMNTAGGLEILHNLIGPLDVSVRGSREYSDYDAQAGARARQEIVDTVGSGLSLRISQTGRLGLNYEKTWRASTEGPGNEFTRYRLFTTLSYGF